MGGLTRDVNLRPDSPKNFLHHSHTHARPRVRERLDVGAPFTYVRAHTCMWVVKEILWQARVPFHITRATIDATGIIND